MEECRCVPIVTGVASVSFKLPQAIASVLFRLSLGDCRCTVQVVTKETEHSLNDFHEGL